MLCYWTVRRHQTDRDREEDQTTLLRLLILIHFNRLTVTKRQLSRLTLVFWPAPKSARTSSDNAPDGHFAACRSQPDAVRHKLRRWTVAHCWERVDGWDRLRAPMKDAWLVLARMNWQHACMVKTDQWLTDSGRAPAGRLCKRQRLT